MTKGMLKDFTLPIRAHKPEPIMGDRACPRCVKYIEPTAPRQLCSYHVYQSMAEGRLKRWYNATEPV